MGATIIDIKNVDINEIPKEEVFAIDTNVLVWAHYSQASNVTLKNQPYQVLEYPSFISRLLNKGNKIVTTNLNITELMGVIERNEYKIYKAVHNAYNLKFKAYRQLAQERANYKKEIDTIMLQIKSMYQNQIEIVDITDDMIQKFQQEICNNRCDIFDYIVIDHLKKMGIHNYISDDKDFSTIDDLNLYTTQ